MFEISNEVSVSGIVQAMIALAGLLFVAFQIRQSIRLSKINLIFQLNERLAGYAGDLQELFKLEGPSDYDGLDPVMRTTLLDYVTVFENIESMRRLRALSPDDIDDFFAGRISELLDHPGVQKAIFFNPAVGHQFAPIFSLHDFWIRSLKKRRKQRPPTETPFEECDPVFYAVMLAKAQAK